MFSLRVFMCVYFIYVHFALTCLDRGPTAAHILSHFSGHFKPKIQAQWGPKFSTQNRQVKPNGVLLFSPTQGHLHGVLFTHAKLTIPLQPTSSLHNPHTLKPPASPCKSDRKPPHQNFYVKPKCNQRCAQLLILSSIRFCECFEKLVKYFRTQRNGRKKAGLYRKSRTLTLHGWTLIGSSMHDHQRKLNKGVVGCLYSINPSHGTYLPCL